MSPDEARAARLYPSTAPLAMAEPIPVTSAAMTALSAKPTLARIDPEQARADRMYAAPAPLAKEEVTPVVAELRDDPARRIYSAEKTYAGSGLATLFQGQENAADEVQAWSGVMADHDVTHDEASSLVGLVRTVKASPPSDEVVTQWGEAALAKLKTQHGPRADALLADARRLIARDPKVAEFLIHSGLGSHERVISLAVEKAASMRAAGRLI